MAHATANVVFNFIGIVICRALKRAYGERYSLRSQVGRGEPRGQVDDLGEHSRLGSENLERQLTVAYPELFRYLENIPVRVQSSVLSAQSRGPLASPQT